MIRKIDWNKDVPYFLQPNLNKPDKYPKMSDKL